MRLSQLGLLITASFLLGCGETPEEASGDPVEPELATSLIPELQVDEFLTPQYWRNHSGGCQLEAEGRGRSVRVPHPDGSSLALLVGHWGDEPSADLRFVHLQRRWQDGRIYSVIYDDRLQKADLKRYGEPVEELEENSPEVKYLKSLAARVKQSDCSERT